jgi:hypothetical protein
MEAVLKFSRETEERSPALVNSSNLAYSSAVNVLKLSPDNFI